MSKKSFSIFFITAAFSVAFISLFTGCGIFGGGKEAEKPQEEAVSEVPKPEGDLAAGQGDKLESDELDLEIETVSGSLNWSKGFIQAKGFGLPPENAVNPQQAKLLAFRAAYADALSSLLETTAGVQVTASTTVKDYIAKDNTVELKVQGIIKGAREIAREFHERDKTAVVQLGIYLEDVARAIPEKDLPGGTINFYKWNVEEDTTLYKIAGDNEELKEAIRTGESLERIEQQLEA